MSRIRLHPAARAELRYAVDWYLNEAGHAIAVAFLEEYGQLQDLVRDHPLIGHGGPLDTRRLAFKFHPYVVIYRLRRGVVEIIAVAHTSRLPNYWSSRL